MITEEQYQDALIVVTKYDNQQYAIALEEAKIKFPIGSYARSQSDWSSGYVYGYGRVGNDVNLKVRCDSSRYPSWFRAKYAKKE